MAKSDGGYLVPREYLHGRYVDVTPRWMKPMVWLGLMKPRLEWSPGLLDMLL